jgi:cytochrome c oxidase cbb3-type subunit III
MKEQVYIAAVLALAMLLGACDQDASTTQNAANDESQANNPEQLEISQVPIAPGGAEPVHQKSPEAAKFDGNPEQIAAGRQLYVAYNCVGCHFNGGGGMGPPLMDDAWIYGSSMENIASTIIEGRPAGMPTFRSMVTGDQVWQLAAYVRSLSGLAEKDEPKENSQ